MKIDPLPTSVLRSRSAELLGQAEDLAEAEPGALAESLVVKNGSKTRAMVSGSCPCQYRRPGARHARPAGRRLARRALVGRADGERSAARHRVASVDRRFRSASSSSPASAQWPQVVGRFDDQLDVQRSDGRSSVVISASTAGQFDQRAAAARTREGEQLSGEAAPRCAELRIHRASAAPSRVVEIARLKIASLQHRGQQVVEVVCDAAGELPNRLHFLCPEQLFARILQL